MSDLNVDQAADLLGVSRWTILRRINRKQLPATRHGKTWQISKAAVTALTAAAVIHPEGQETQPMPDPALPKLMNLDEVSKLTGLSRWWLGNACRRRLVEHIRVGRRIQMTPEQAQAAIKAAATDSTADRELQAELAFQARKTRRRSAA